MNLVMGDVVHFDQIEFTVPRTALSAGSTHSSMEENIKALFESIGLELMELHTVIRTPICATQISHDANGSPVEHITNSVHIRLMSNLWTKNLRG